MEIIIYNNAQQVAESAAQWVKELIKKKPNLVLGLATDSTPIRLYKFNYKCA
jgi:glucosamine-6-phosphate deaminase